jgi:hypothetical protein
MNPTRCSFVKIDGEQCNRRAHSGGRCPAHDGREYCAGSGSNGQPCQMYAERDSDLCYLHDPNYQCVVTLWNGTRCPLHVVPGDDQCKRHGGMLGLKPRRPQSSALETRAVGSPEAPIGRPKGRGI